MQKKKPQPKPVEKKEDPSRLISLMGRSKYNKMKFDEAQAKALQDR